MPASAHALDIQFPEELVQNTLLQPRPGLSKVHWLTGSQAFFKPKNESSSWTIQGLEKYMALERAWWFWVRPTFGKKVITTSGDSKPDELLFVMVCNEDQSEHMLLLPLMAGDWRAYLRPVGEDGLRLGIHGGVDDSQPELDQPLLMVAQGPEPKALVEEAMALLSDTLRSFKLAKDKRVPAFVDWFGWCTWDAFYQEVSAEKVLDGLKSFKEGGLSPKFMILDDGWQDVDEKGCLNAFEANEKFPNDLGALTARAKSEYGVEMFGLWHALQGYWGGVNPTGPLAKEYAVEKRQGLKPCNMDEQEVGVVTAKDIYRFYQDFYAHLAKQGIDMVKVDSQAGLQELKSDNYHEFMRAYQLALQGAAHTHFEGNLLHCMSNAQEVAYNMAGSVAWRNSDDFYPTKEESHHRHLVYNAYNALWSSSFSIPDWDMFKSGHPTGPFHGAARGISGGPIYVSDGPGEQDFELIRKLVLSNGKALRSSSAATVDPSRLYDNPMAGEGLLLVQNKNGASAVLGAFNCHREGLDVSDVFGPKNAGLQQGRYVRYRFGDDNIQVVDAEFTEELQLPKQGFVIDHYVPVDRGIAALGLLDKFNATAAVISARWEGNNYRCSILDGGRVGFYSEQKIKSVIDGTGAECAFEQHDQTGLVSVELPSDGEQVLTLHL